MNTDCLNCRAPLLPAQRYCSQCGQRCNTRRLTLAEMAHDFVHALLHVDHSLLALLRALLTQPGTVARRYVQGERKRHLGPFVFLLVAVGAASLTAAMLQFRIVTSNAASAPLAFMQSHPNVLLLLQVPVLAAMCRLLFWRWRMNFAEYMVLAAYASGMRALLFLLGVLGAHFMPASAAALAWPLYLYYAVWAGYFALAASQFHPPFKWVTPLLGALAAVLAMGATLLAVRGLAGLPF